MMPWNWSSETFQTLAYFIQAIAIIGAIGVVLWNRHFRTNVAVYLRPRGEQTLLDIVIENYGDTAVKNIRLELVGNDSLYITDVDEYGPFTNGISYLPSRQSIVLMAIHNRDGDSMKALRRGDVKVKVIRTGFSRIVRWPKRFTLDYGQWVDMPITDSPLEKIHRAIEDSTKAQERLLAKIVENMTTSSHATLETTGATDRWVTRKSTSMEPDSSIIRRNPRFCPDCGKPWDQCKGFCRPEDRGSDVETSES